MLTLSFIINNPFWVNKRFENLLCLSGKTWLEHKFWEFEVLKESCLFAINIRSTIKKDHAGLSILFGLLGYSVEYTFYDNRHWNYSADRYVNCNDLNIDDYV